MRDMEQRIDADRQAFQAESHSGLGWREIDSMEMVLLWGMRRKEMAEQHVTKAPQKSAKATQRGPTKGGSRRMNPAAAAALRRAELQRTTYMYNLKNFLVMYMYTFGTFYNKRSML